MFIKDGLRIFDIVAGEAFIFGVFLKHQLSTWSIAPFPWFIVNVRHKIEELHGLVCVIENRFIAWRWSYFKPASLALCPDNVGLIDSFAVREACYVANFNFYRLLWFLENCIPSIRCPFDFAHGFYV